MGHSRHWRTPHMAAQHPEADEGRDLRRFVGRRWNPAQAGKKPIAPSAMIAAVPDIRLQKPATMVAIITTLTLRRSMIRPRMVLRMMMKGAANTRNGTAANAAGAGPRWMIRKLAGRLV